MIAFSPSCTPTTPLTCKEALTRCSQWNPSLDLELLSSRIMNATASHFPMNKPTEKESDPHTSFFESRVIIALHPEGLSVAILENYSQQGSGKKVSSALLATANTVFKVAFVITKQTPLRKVDWTARELGILTQLTQKSEKGCVGVLMTHALPSPQTDLKLQTRFASFQDWFGSDLYPFVSDKNLSTQLHPKYRTAIQNKIVAAVNEFHNNTGLIHRDIKPENFLINISIQNQPIFDKPIHALLGEYNPEIQIDIRLCDFAFAIPKTTAPTDPNPAGTNAYMFPEIANMLILRRTKSYTDCDHAAPSVQSDLWAMGLVLLCLEDYATFYKVIPFQEANSVVKQKNQEWIRETVFLQTYQKYFEENNIPHFPEPKDKNSRRYMLWRILRPRSEDSPSFDEVKKVFA